jgi:hypothetical protein
MTLKQNLQLVIGADAWPIKPLREGALTALAACNLAWTTARLARLTLRTFYVSPNDARDVSQEQVRRRVLLLPRARLNDDVLNAFKRVDATEVVALPRGVFKLIAAAFLPGEVQDNNYASVSPSAQLAIERYRAFLTRFWRAFDPHRHIVAVVTGNFGYYAERELAAALETLGVPLIVLHKENPAWSPGNQSFWEWVYRERRGPFKGRRILVYSPIERDLQLRAGVVDANRIEVVGMPRLDEVHLWRKANVGLIPKPTVLFASFLPEVGMPLLGMDDSQRGENTGGREDASRSFSLGTLCARAHRAVVDLAASCPEITVLVKTKGRPRDLNALPGLLGVSGQLPSNLRVVHGGSPLPLIAQAAVVGGLHSTLLLEALAAGRPVVVPWFAEVLNPLISPYVFDLGLEVVRASSPEEFTERLKELALTRTPVPKSLRPETSKVLREWLGNDDGRAGERAAEAILRVIEGR